MDGTTWITKWPVAALAGVAAGAAMATLWAGNRSEPAGHKAAATLGAVKIFDAAAVARLLPMVECVEVTRAALRALSSGTAVMPVRQVVRLPLKDPQKLGILAGMPSFFHEAGDTEFPPICGMKVITVFPGNVGTKWSAHQGLVMLFEAEHGALQSISDAHEITAIRTAAASAVATDVLSNPDSAVLAILGTSVQAVQHIEAMRVVRPGIREIRIWGRTASKATALVARMQSEHPGLTITSFGTAHDAVTGADIVCTLTAANTPILCGAWLKEGAHVNAVGACTPNHREIDTECVTACKVYVDTMAACVKEPGDIVTPIKEGVDVQIVGEIGDVMNGVKPGRASPTERTLFKSVGAAVEDLFAAAHITAKVKGGLGRGA